MESIHSVIGVIIYEKTTRLKLNLSRCSMPEGLKFVGNDFLYLISGLDIDLFVFNLIMNFNLERQIHINRYLD